MKSKKKQIDDIKDQFEQWLERNRNMLPLNIDTWNVDFIGKEQQEQPRPEATLGRYHARKVALYAFYKPISRILPIPSGPNEMKDD